MTTHLRQTRTREAQQIERFTGEGAYHGSTRPREQPQIAAPPPPVVDEMRPRTLERYVAEGRREIAEFAAVFPDRCDVVDTLPPVDQDTLSATA